MARDQVALPGRRRMLQGVGALSLSLAGGSLLAGCSQQVAPFFAGSSSPRPETTAIRFPGGGSGTCVSPVLVRGRAD